MSRGGVIEGAKRKPPVCRPHRVNDHRDKGAIIQCLGCGAWFYCATHRSGGRCRAEAVKWWHLRAQRKISAYIARGDQDGEAE